MEKERNILGAEPIGKLLLKFAIPGIVSMLVNSIYDIVDQIFIGQGLPLRLRSYYWQDSCDSPFPYADFAKIYGDCRHHV